MEKNPIDMLMDETNSENIVLYDEDGQAVEFEQIAVIELGTALFALLHPVELTEDNDEDTAIVFLVNQDNETMDVVEDEDTIDEVFEEYYRLLREAGVDVD